MHKDKATLTSLAKLASGAYLGPNKTPLNESIKKIAQSEGLSPVQIEVVVAEANKDVWSRLFSMSKTASYDFPLADTKVIVGELKNTNKPVVIKESDDYASGPVKTASFDPAAAFGVQMEKTASDAGRVELKRELRTRLEKMAMAKEHIGDELFVIRTKIANDEIQFAKQARELLLQEPFSERGEAMKKIAQFVYSASPKYAKLLMSKLSSVARGQGLIKEADLQAPEQYISDKMQARIINGNHALYLTIKTLHEDYENQELTTRRYELVDSSIPMVREKIREL